LQVAGVLLDALFQGDIELHGRCLHLFALGDFLLQGADHVVEGPGEVTDFIFLGVGDTGGFCSTREEDLRGFFNHIVTLAPEVETSQV
jgi:hypothetical protein